MLNLIVNGAAGRMGCRVVANAVEADGFEIVAALEASGHPQLGNDAGTVAGCPALGVPITDALPDVAADVVIDFSKPEGAAAVTALCESRKLPLVLATTGLSEETHAALHRASETIPIVHAPNMSLSVNLAMKLCAIAGRTLAGQAGQVDVEIIEKHHHFKEDAPSGTALRFGRIIAAEMGQTEHRHGREGMPGRRPAAEIGYHAVRTGDNPGEHTIIFAPMGESLEITVRATSRDCYAQGALAAARFLVGKPPGMYGMEDVLGMGMS